MGKIVRYLQLNETGLLEVLFAFFPILLAYNYFGIPGDIFLLLLLDAIAITKKFKFSCPSILGVLFVYIILHEIIVFIFCTDQPQYMVNAMITHVVVFVSIPILIGSLNPQKLPGAFNLVSIICIVGIVYHFFVVFSGGAVYTIRIPFLSAPSTSRFFIESYRPVSFFWEPQSYCSYMLIPLFFSLISKRFIWTIIVVFSMLLSTSTTGIILAPVVLLTYTFTQNKKLKAKIGMTILTIAIGFSLYNFSIFDQGVEKLENVDASTNIRLSSGIEYIKHLDKTYLILGIPSANPTDFYLTGGVKGADMDVSVNYGSLYISTFWLVFIKFGIVGLVLYIVSLCYPAKNNKKSLLYIVPLLCGLFSNPDFINSAFALEVIVLYTFINNKTNNNGLNKYEGININYTIRK